MRKVKCACCDGTYPSVSEDDWTGECAECEELSPTEKLKKTVEEEILKLWGVK
jgi:hypothetical protein